MARGEAGPGGEADEARPRGLVDSIDAAADDLEANGPVPPEEVRRALLELKAEWAAGGRPVARPRRRTRRRTRP